MELLGGDVAPAPVLTVTAKQREMWTSQQMEQILRGDHMDMWGFGPVGKVKSPLPPVWERITDNSDQFQWLVTGRMKIIKMGKVQPCDVWDEGLNHPSLHSLELGEAAEG